MIRSSESQHFAINDFISENIYFHERNIFNLLDGRFPH